MVVDGDDLKFAGTDAEQENMELKVRERAMAWLARLSRHIRV